MTPLNQIKIASPCTESWAAMEGDERQRFCKVCRKNVYNLSAMTADEANALLASHSDLCVRYFRRKDGTVMTSDCPVGKARVRKRRTVSFAWAMTLITSGLYVMSRNVQAVGFAKRTAADIRMMMPQPSHKLMGSVAGSVANSQ